MTPGVLPNGLFWTTAIPSDAFVIKRHWARLKLNKLPVCDNFQFGGFQSVGSEVSTSVHWKATTKRQDRGSGTAVDPADFAAFSGRFSDASCTGKVSGHQTGFGFGTHTKLDASGFFAEFGTESKGHFLT
jgi:hypothetical protein